MRTQTLPLHGGRVNPVLPSMMIKTAQNFVLYPGALLSLEHAELFRGLAYGAVTVYLGFLLVTIYLSQLTGIRRTSQ